MAKMKLGEKQGCLFDDRVSVEFSPADLERLRDIFQQRAVDAEDYHTQGQARELADRFEQAFREWEAERKKT